MYLLYYTFYHYFRVYASCLFKNSKTACYKTVCHVKPAAISYTPFLLCLLIASSPLVLDLISYCFANFVETECAVFTKPTVAHSTVLGLHTHSPLTHWLTQSNAQSCKPHSRQVPHTGVPCLFQVCYFLPFTLYFYCAFSMFRYVFNFYLLILNINKTIFIFNYEKGKDGERDISMLFCLFMHLLVDSCMGPD